MYYALPHFSQHPGPPLGSVLYEWAGFGVPYYVVGSLILTVTFSFVFLIPKMKRSDEV